MLTLQKVLSSALLLAVMVIPVMAGTEDAKPKNDEKPNSEGAANTTPAPATSATPTPNLATTDANVTALLGVLVMKGVLAPAEANSIRNAAPTAQFQILMEALTRKGVLTAADLSAAEKPAPPSAAASAAAAVSSTSAASSAPATFSTSAAASAPAATSSASATPAVFSTSAETQPIAAGPAEAVPVTAATAAQRQEVAQNPPQKKPSAPGVVPAIVPLRVLALDPPVKDGLVPSFKVGAVKVTPYGFIKATAVHDSSDPNGDDFPFPGIFLNSSSVLSTGPTEDPSFHLKARSSRFGSSFEWPDVAKGVTITGKVEGDFEGGFTEVDNADVTSIRNPQPRLRLAFGRVDYAPNDASDVFFEAGQDWTLFGSGALPNILETTFLGAFSGDIYDRSPQFRFGLVQKLGDSDRHFKISPEFALMMPSSGEIYKLQGPAGSAVSGFEAQIGEGEREGADSGRPEFEGKVALQFQLDKAPAVSSAQIFWSGFEGKRTSITTSANITGTNILATFPNGFTNSSHMFGNQIAVQLPTRWLTLVASAYRGGDMRFMLAGQLNTFLTDTTGLYGVVQVPTVDNVQAATGGMEVGCSVPVTGVSCTASGGTWRIAPEHPIGAFGGFINVGLPLSRWFNADPKGRNSAWNLYLHVGKDQVVHHDLEHASGIGCASADGLTGCNGGIPLSQSRMVAATLYYKLNAFTTFAFEQSQYQTTLLPDLLTLPVPVTYSIAGVPAGKWKDQRTEFGPIFTF
jgi:hypothetical protein